jgi:sirohydrochlorin ferrochelatase
MPEPPTLVLAAHGTRSPAGALTTARLVAAIASARPSVPVQLCFLDVASPSLREALDAATDPLVVVPLLLSAGFHVTRDIPELVAGRAGVRVAAHLGPAPLIVEALLDRLPSTQSDAPVGSTLLARVGSTYAGAGADFAAARAQLAERLGREVAELRLDGSARTTVAALPAPVEIASYLLAEGEFLTRLRDEVAGLAVVADPIGAHPALVQLVWERYDSVTA